MSMLKIRNLQKKDIGVITKIMLEFPDAYGKDYVHSKKKRRHTMAVKLCVIK